MKRFNNDNMDDVAARAIEEETQSEKSPPKKSVNVEMKTHDVPSKVVDKVQKVLDKLKLSYTIQATEERKSARTSSPAESQE